MKVFQKLLSKLRGIHFPQDFLCLEKEHLQHPLHLWIIHHNRVALDITNSHSFVGYCPLIFALPSSAQRNFEENIQVVFTAHLLTINESFSEKDAVARLFLRKIKEQHLEHESIAFYEGVSGSHRFISGFQQKIDSIYNWLYHQKPGNVYLRGNLYQQVQMAYALPRKICLVTVEENNLYNLFPTDLHGRWADHYIISLRHQGKACQQVETAGKILLSDMPATEFKKVYALGKNHMQPLKPTSAFEFNGQFSKTFQLPLPAHVSSWKELELQSSFIAGIHKILIFKILAEEVIKMGGTLAHIHSTYATWREKNGLQTNYLLR